MPIIQQERGVKTVKGLPARWGVRAYRELSAALAGGAESARYTKLCQLLDDVTNAPIPLDATDAQICILAEVYANDCASVGMPREAEPCDLKTGVVSRIHTLPVTDPATLRGMMARVCRLRGIEPPAIKDDAMAIARCVDSAWWRRNLRRVHGRAFEAAAIRLGFVSIRAGMYASDETVHRRIAQVERNKAALAAVTMVNEHGAEFGLDKLAAKGTSNKRIRRGELMLRLAGCEDVANEVGHVGVFITLTAPSKYHAVIQASGTLNKNYQDYNPREVQAYLQKTWGRIRTAYGRHQIKPYGFRIAEPHHDGCVHWHALLFMPAEQVETFCGIVRRYALAEDGDEPGARAKRVEFEMIDSAKGSAAAYIAKYISKNINDDSEDAHDEVIDENGNVVKLSFVNDKKRKASQRVDAWAGVWGVRQFQPIGQPPVTVWRELRRVAEGEVKEAADNVRAAWEAAQRVYGAAAPETGECELIHAANYGDYIRAQGGVAKGRGYAIGVAQKPARVEGRYGVYEGMAPAGVYSRQCDAGPMPLHESTRYEWTRKQTGVDLRSSWSPVNNCTPPAWAADVLPGELVAEFDDAWFDSDEYQKFFVPPEVVAAEMLAAELAAVETRTKTAWTRLSSDKLGGMAC